MFEQISESPTLRIVQLHAFWAKFCLHKAGKTISSGCMQHAHQMRLSLFYARRNKRRFQVSTSCCEGSELFFVLHHRSLVFIWIVSAP